VFFGSVRQGATWRVEPLPASRQAIIDAGGLVDTRRGLLLLWCGGRSRLPGTRAWCLARMRPILRTMKHGGHEIHSAGPPRVTLSFGARYIPASAHEVAARSPESSHDEIDDCAIQACDMRTVFGKLALGGCFRPDGRRTK